MLKYCVITVLLSISSFSSFTFGAEGKPTIRISSLHEGKDILAIRENIAKAYQDIGYAIEIVSMPAKRSLYEAQQNDEIDAELIRASEAQQLLKNYIKIPIPLVTTNINAYTINKINTPLSWQDIAKYNPITVRGIILIEGRLKASGVEFNSVNSVPQAINMVNLGRADMAILPEPLFNELYKGSKKKEYQFNSLVIEESSFYHYIHKRHHKLVPELTESIKLAFGHAK